MNSTKQEKVLVFHIGHLGDTLMIVPSLHVLKENFPGAIFTLLTDRILNSNFVIGASVFRGTVFFDEIITFPKIKSAAKVLLNPLSLMYTLPRLLIRRFDAVAYLVPSRRRSGQIERDRKYFRLAGIRRLYGFQGFGAERQQNADPNSKWMHEADAILQRLELDGFRVPSPGRANMNLLISESERADVSNWFAVQGNEHFNKPLVGFGPGSKMSAKKWPIERFAEVGRILISQHNIWPVIFGGAADKKIGAELLRIWQRGYNAAGDLGIRLAAEALSRCSIYIGNDTGTMHLAAAVGAPCVAIFSARDVRGKWEPYGMRHKVLRSDVECAGCMKTECASKKCLLDIQVEDVIQELIGSIFNEKY